MPRAGTIWASSTQRRRGDGWETITVLFRQWPAAERHRQAQLAQGIPATIWRAKLDAWEQVTR